MAQQISLDGTWGLSWTEFHDLEHFMTEELGGHRPLAARVPSPIHQVLLDAKLIDAPTVGLNALKARWVEEQHWISRRRFECPSEALEVPAWLVFDRFEYELEVRLNGRT